MTTSTVEPTSSVWASLWPRRVAEGWLVLAGLLWIAWFVLLVGEAALGTLSADQTTHIPKWARMLSSATLVLAGWVFANGMRRLPVSATATLIAIGMTLGFVGDLFNADLIPISGLADPVLGGIVAFGLGHLAYMAGLIGLGRRAGYRFDGARWACILFWQVLGVIGWYLAVYRGNPTSVLAWPALPYSLLLAGTAGMTSSLAVDDPRFLPLATGGALFLLSDLLLAARLFHGDYYLAGDAVWLTYGPAQMLIVYSLPIAAAVLERPRAGRSLLAGGVGLR